MAEVYYYGEAPTSSSQVDDIDFQAANFVKRNATSSSQRTRRIRKGSSPAAVGIVSGVVLSALTGVVTDVGSFVASTPITRTLRAESAAPSSSRGGSNEKGRNSPNVKDSQDSGRGEFASSIRRVHASSGLTWDEIARLVGVSRRTVHNWIQGARVSSANARTLSRVCTTLEREDKGDPASTRAHLLAPRLGGMSPYERMLARRLDNEPKHVDDFNPSQRVSMRESPPDVHGALLNIEELD
ncbi:helix-turn-helix domain-containing protein [Amycolatopsis sp. NPDC058278]|uniref:helix-turn-helix domain-containing protein n=1 Tax=Amycolatopsis sp. NPDC058278 TaxID=3346417 RepID=UPI0036DF2B13